MLGVGNRPFAECDPHMRARSTPAGNNRNSIYWFHPNQMGTFVLFPALDPIVRAKTVVCGPTCLPEIAGE